MPSKPEEPAVNQAKQMADFKIAKVGGKFYRFQPETPIPEGATPITLDSVNGMSKEDISDLYSQVASVPLKKFKDKRVAIESLIYQIQKLPVFGKQPEAPQQSPRAATRSASGSAQPAQGPDAGKYARKAPDKYTLQEPPELDKVLKDLAPQARELVLIMTELAKSKGLTEFTGEELSKRLKETDVADRLHTRQDPLRILQYYKGKLISSGLIRVS